MIKIKNTWKRPKEKDVLFYKWADIKKKINPPPLWKRGLFSIKLVRHHFVFLYF